MQQDNLPRPSRFTGAVVAGTVVAIVLVMFTGSPVWDLVFLILAIVNAFLWPIEEIRQAVAWPDRSVPLPSWPYWLVSGITYLAVVGVIAALIASASALGVVCAIIAFVGLNAQILMRAVQIKRSLDLPPQPPLSPLHSNILAGSLVGYAVAFFAILLEQYVLALVVGVPAVISLIVLTRDRRRLGRRVLEDALRKRRLES
jgi:hypothetical protein